MKPGKRRYPSYSPEGPCHRLKVGILNGKALTERKAASRSLLLENTVDGAIVIPALRMGSLGILKEKAIGNRVLSMTISTRHVTTTQVALGWAMMDLLTEFSAPLVVTVIGFAVAVRCLTVDRVTPLGVLLLVGDYSWCFTGRGRLWHDVVGRPTQ